MPAGVPYHLLHRAGRPGWWRPVVGTVAAGIGVFVLSAFVVVVPFLIGYGVAGEPLAVAMKRLTDFGDPTPAGLAYLNLTLASAIPITWLMMWSLHGLRPGWLTSVRPRLRWGYFAACLVASVLSLGATVLVSLFLPDQGGVPGGGLNRWTDQMRDFVLVIAFLTPLQAAGEEYLFRGYLTQVFGGLTGSRVLAVLGPALLFGLAHGLGQGPWVFLDRFAFGVIAGILVLVTGGLEAGIAMHVLNNFLAFGLALAFSDLGEALNASGGSPWLLVGTLTQSLSYLALAWGLARVLGLSNSADPGVLAGPGTHVYRDASVRGADPESPWGMV